MRVLFDVSHPAHVHLFKHAADRLREAGHEVHVASREREVTTDLLEAADLPYSTLTRERDGVAGTAREWLTREARLLRLARRFDPDVVVSRLNPPAAHVSRLLGVPNVVFHDTEFAGMVERITTPFAGVVCTPARFERDLGDGQRRYEGFHELAYLHPERFEPDPDALRASGVDPDEPYAVLRFVAMGAHHDAGHRSIGDGGKRELVERLEDAGLTVYVSSEGPLPAGLEDRDVPVPPEDLHQLLAHADVYAGDSGTTAIEAAVLGTPTVRLNPYDGEMGNFEELHEYGLVTTVGDDDRFVDEAVDLATDPDAGERWRSRRREMLEDKVDVTAYMLDTIGEVAGEAVSAEPRGARDGSSGDGSTDEAGDAVGGSTNGGDAGGRLSGVEADGGGGREDGSSAGGRADADDRADDDDHRGDDDRTGDDERPVPDGHTFSLLLTHDVDRPYKTYQSLYYALTEPERRRYHLSTALPGRNPYWQFETLMDLEDDLGVRSAFYVLREQRLFRDRPPREWVSMEGWQLFAGRYTLSDPDVLAVLGRLDRGGWELGLHGSYESPDDRAMLREEKEAVEEAVGRELLGGRQHYLNLSRPETWEHYRSIGLSYDTTLGSSDEYGFDHGHGILRPFDDEFVVFPLTAMEQALPDPGDDFDRAWAACEELLQEAREEGAVMTVLWHPRHFSEGDFPGHRRLYRRLVERALDLGAWVGSPGQLYEQERLDEPPGERSDGSDDDAGRATGGSVDRPGADGPDDPVGGPDGPRDGPDNLADGGREEITNPARTADGSE